MTAETRPASAHPAQDGRSDKGFGAVFRRLIRFVIVGVAATVTHFGILIAAVELFGVDPRYGNVLGFGTAVFVTYFGNYLWSFRTRHSHRETIPRFAVVSTALFITSQGLMLLVLDVFKLHYGFGIVLIVVVNPLVSFFLQQRLVFLRPGAPS